MKKITTIFLLVFFFTNVFAQKVIISPEHGFSTFDSRIEKIEILDTTTVIHFHYKNTPGSKYSIPKKTFIQDVNGGEKLYITKGGEGIKLNKWQEMPESGEIFYALFFPKLNDNVNAIDFGEDNSKASWAIYDIVLKENEDDLYMPKALRGNWMLTNGSNKWEYSFNSKNAIVDRAIWNYKSVKIKKNTYTITLEKGEQLKTIYAKIDKNGQVAIGENKKDLKTYSNTCTNNPNYKLKNDEPYTWPIFKNDNATYSGIVNGYTPRIGESTTMLYVNNTFTGDQESHLIKIAEDGSFSISFPIAYPQFVLVRGVGVSMNVFIEPGKETFHFIDSGAHLFMGDCAQVNTDLVAMKSINYFDYREAYKEILTIDPQDYKERIIAVQNREMDSLNSLVKTQFISQKAVQLKKLDIEISALTNIISYDLQKSSALRRQEKENKENMPLVNETELDASYYNLLTKAVLDDKLAVMARDYSTLINRFMFADIFRDNSRVSIRQNTTEHLAEQLQKQGVKLTDDELKMVDASKEVQTEDFRKRQNAFNEKYAAMFSKFLKQHYKIFDEIGKDKEKSLDLIASLKAEGVELSNETESMLQVFNTISTPEEKEKQFLFNETYGDAIKDFYKNHSKFITDIYSQDRNNKLIDKMSEVLDIKEAFVFDVVKLQQNLSNLDRNMEPYTENKVEYLQQLIQTPFLANYISVENDKLKAKIEANKTKEGYAVNHVEKTEGDELFESMIHKFKGKVVYVDFWATWCGPCKTGINRIKPLKEEMKGEDVVFLYITGPSSPEKTWENSIPDIKGEHYRVSKDEWNYLTDKFKITGIPHYALVNKEGEVVNDKLGHKNNMEIKTLLNKEMGK